MPKKASSATSNGLESLFLDGLKDIYYAEKKILKALPKLAKAAQSEKISAAFEKHLKETEDQVDRLEQVFDMLGKPARGRPALLSTASSRRARKSLRNTRTSRRLTQDWWVLPKRWSITKSRATVR